MANLIKLPGETVEATEDVTVIVAASFQVVHAGTVYGPGSSASVPESVAERWIKCGWVKRAK